MIWHLKTIKLEGNLFRLCGVKQFSGVSSHHFGTKHIFNKICTGLIRIR